MRKLKIGFFVALLTVVAQAGTKASKVVPAVLAHARYVALGYDLGDGFLSENSIIQVQRQVPPEDQEALKRVRSELEKWKLYVITMRPSEAELLIVVRTGRVVSANISVRPGRASGQTYGGEVSSPNDMLEVFEAVQGKEGTLLWRKSQKDGLSGSPPPLFEQFRRDVDSIPVPHH